MVAGDIPDVRQLLDDLERCFGDELLDGRPRSLRAYIGVPGTAAQLRRHLRNAAIREADGYVDGGPWIRAVRIAAEWRRFNTCTPWPATVGQAQPPAELRSGLRRAVWRMVKYSAPGEVLTPEQIANVLRAK
jgi:hypothetical protein